MPSAKRREIRLNAGLCAYCGKEPYTNGAYCSTCLRKTIDRNIIKQHRQREQVINHYGNFCNCCKKTYPYKYYELDHVNSDGKVHRDELGKGSTKLIIWVIQNNYPDSIQILCANCHKAKTGYGGCTQEDHDVLLGIS